MTLLKGGNDKVIDSNRQDANDGGENRTIIAHDRLDAHPAKKKDDDELERAELRDSTPPEQAQNKKQNPICDGGP